MQEQEKKLKQDEDKEERHKKEEEDNKGHEEAQGTDPIVSDISCKRVRMQKNGLKTHLS